MDTLVARFLGWIVGRLGAQTLLSVALLLIAQGSVALGLSYLVRGLDTGLTLPVAVSGALMGWVLAKSPLPGWLGGILAFVLGAEVGLIRLGRLDRPLMALLRPLVDLAWEGLRWPLDGPPDGTPVVLALAEVSTGVSTLLTRVRDWLLALTKGQGAFDPVATALLWSLTLWIVAVWASWAVRRRERTIQGIAPAGALLAITLSYVGGPPYFLVPLLGATWMLRALMGQNARERAWERKGTDFCMDIRLELMSATIGISVMLMVTAMMVPSVSWRQITQFAERLFMERDSGGKQVADSLGLEPGPGPDTVFDQVRKAGLPRRCLLGSGPGLSEQVVMVISTGDLPPGMPDIALSLPPRYYWRGLTYDLYSGRGWYTGATKDVEYQAGELAAFEGVSVTSPFYRAVRQKIEAVGDLGGLLYVTGELVTADHDFIVAWRPPGDAFGAQIWAAAYRADSLVPRVSEPQLRSAGSDYPDWVRDRYLALPDEVHPRVLGLARDLTATEPTPYDRACAIESYLRTFPYTLDLPAPPLGRDVADYFLFDLRQGYCDYYATAMVVLARAAGLPARLVVGYASGVYGAMEAHYIVTEADAHSWVEHYFPGYGWVEFESTGGRPPIERSAETLLFETSAPKAPLKPMGDGRIRVVHLGLLGLLAALVALTLVYLVWWVADGWRLRRMPPVAAVVTLYQRLYRYGQRLAVPAGVGTTPYEFAADLVGRVAELAQDKRFGVVLASTVQEVRWLTDLYVRGLYSRYGLSAAEKAQAIETWQRLRRQLWLAWVWQKGGGLSIPLLQ